MTLPDGRPLIVADGVFAEPASADGRLTLWLPGEVAGGYRLWDRVGNVARAEVVSERGIRSAAATSIPARQRLAGMFGRLLRGLARPAAERSWALPGGGSAEQCGPRMADLVLAWPDGDAPLDDARIRARWPACRDVRPLGPGLFLVSGIDPPRPRSEPGPAAEGSPIVHAERSLAAARSADDPRRTATALADLGLASLLGGDGPRAAAMLAESLAEARRAADPALEADALGGLASVALALGRPALALGHLAPALAYARSAGDRHAEKAALERVGQAHVALGDHDAAFNGFERALAIAAEVGDRAHEAQLLWLSAVEDAELGRRDRALARSQAAVALLRGLGSPKADWFAHHLDNYRADAATPLATPGAALLPPSYLGGSIDVGVMPSRTAAPPSAAGPGPLRMALTAAKSMAQFVGSGFRTAAPDTAAARLAACASCPHHTGLRCRICGCFTAAKARLDHERCPAGKWPA